MGSWKVTEVVKRFVKIERFGLRERERGKVRERVYDPARSQAWGQR